MARRPALSRRLAVAAAWPIGIGLTSWNYMWRTTPLHRRERTGSPVGDAGPEFPDCAADEEVQRPEDGFGPFFHRRYQVRINGAHLSAEALISQIRADLNRVAPLEFARFTKVSGDKTEMNVGDEYVVSVPGPWDGPLRVVSVTPTSFRLVTLEGHLEAGQVEFRAWPDCDLVFCVESWARSGDRLSSLLYGRLHMAKEVQLHMWTSVLESGAKLVGGRIIGGIDIETRRVDGDEPRLGDPEARKGLDELHDRNLNFDAARRDEITTDNGWRIDHYARALPSESPGPPLAGASWETACRLMRDYEFADPKIVRAVFRPDDPLEGRDMLLEARFHGLRFHLGVRVGGVLDETREIDGRPVRVWGWNYSTLQGHLEMGQIDYEVWKWTDTGQVEFHVSCFSRAAPVANPILRLGFRLFGRREQVRFARHACDRMARLTAAALRDGDAAKEIPRAGEVIRVGSSSDGRPH